MKYSLKSIKINAPGEIVFSVEGIEVEFDLPELKQFAENTQTVVMAFQYAVKDLLPLISEHIERHETRDHIQRMARLNAEMEKENLSQKNWRERNDTK